MYANDLSQGLVYIKVAKRLLILGGAFVIVVHRLMDMC